MPQIAQQDYIKAVATPGRQPQYDCNVLSVLAKAREVGTLLDVIIVYNDGPVLCQGKIFAHDENMVVSYDVLNSSLIEIEFPYSPGQYAALSVIQLEFDELEGSISDMPQLVNSAGYLKIVEGYSICTPDGYKYAVTAADGVITSISVSNELQVGDYIVIDEETAQDLIGLPIE